MGEVNGKVPKTSVDPGFHPTNTTTSYAATTE